MLNRTDVVYRYDGSFEGLMCCVFESYEKKELPCSILSPADDQVTLFAVKEIVTDPAKAARVQSAIPKSMGEEVYSFIQRAFLTCLTERERYILQFLRLGFSYGSLVMDMLADDTVDILTKAVRYLEREAHLFKEFIRFSDYSGVLVSEIEPNNVVLPLLVEHFCPRIPEERFLIYDKVLGMALMYEPYEPVIVECDSLELPEEQQKELDTRALWQLFYDTIEVQGRHNERCRMGHMPKRYWKHMTEFNRPPRKAASTPVYEGEPALLARKQSAPPVLAG